MAPKLSCCARNFNADENVVLGPAEWFEWLPILPVNRCQQSKDYAAYLERQGTARDIPHHMLGHYTGDNPEQAFREFAREHGVTLPDKLLHGKIQRFNPDDGGRKNDKGWCVFRGDFGKFGIWGTEIEEGVNWFAKKANGAALTEAERQAQKKQIDAAKRQYDLEVQRQHKEIAKKARDILDAADPAPDSYPYLIDKGVTANGLRLHEGRLVMGLQDEHGIIWSYQFITEDGDKRFPVGKRKSGLFYLIGGPIPFEECTIYIGEGFATMASVHAADGAPCVVAGDKGNLLAVAMALRGVRKKARFVICADSDAWTGNPGEHAAIQAAAAIDALVATPVFVNPRTYGKTDFNDLARLEDLDAVKRCLDAAIAPPPSGEQVGGRGTTKDGETPDAPDIVAAKAAKVREAAARLALLDPTEYQLCRIPEADSLQVTVKYLDGLVAALRKAKRKEARNLRLLFDLDGVYAGLGGSGGGSGTGTGTGTEGVSLSDFYAVLPLHQYLFVPTRALWPAETINSLFGEKDDDEPPSTTLDKSRGVHAMTWAPGLPLIVKNKLVCDAGWIDRKDCRTLNLYRPPAIGPGDANDVEPWLNLVRKIYPANYERILDFLAHPVQRPQVKINHALVLGGAPGIGKDTILEPVKYAIGPWNFAEVSPEQLTGRFNPFLKSVILRMSEARDLGEVDKYSLYERTKTMWAAPPDMLTVDEKNLKTHPVVNVLAGIITTNHRTDGLYLPADDRRHFVLWSNVTKEDEDFEGDYWKNLWGWYYGENGIENVAAFLKARDLSGFDPKAPPEKTAAFWAMVDNARSSEETELYDELEQLFWPNAITLEQVIAAAEGEIKGWLSERKNRSSIPHKFERCGYVALRKDGSKDGRWKVGGKNMVIYVRKTLTGKEQREAAAALIEMEDKLTAARQAAADKAARRAREGRGL